MKKLKVILAGILVIFTLVLATKTITTTNKIATQQNSIYAETSGGGPIYPPPIFSPELPGTFV